MCPTNSPSLPSGCSCANCGSLNRCILFAGIDADNTVCAYSPSEFHTNRCDNLFLSIRRNHEREYLRVR